MSESNNDKAFYIAYFKSGYEDHVIFDGQFIDPSSSSSPVSLKVRISQLGPIVKDSAEFIKEMKTCFLGEPTGPFIDYLKNVGDVNKLKKLKKNDLLQLEFFLEFKLNRSNDLKAIFIRRDRDDLQNDLDTMIYKQGIHAFTLPSNFVIVYSQDQGRMPNTFPGYIPELDIEKRLLNIINQAWKFRTYLVGEENVKEESNSIQTSLDDFF